MNELDLIQQAQRGGLGAFNELVLLHQRLAYNVAYRVLGEPDAAADATQEAFLSAYRHLAQFRGGSFKSWLLRIVTNACYDELRRRKRQPQASLEALFVESATAEANSVQFLSDSTQSLAELSEQQALNAAIENCLAGLPPEQRAALVLCDVQEFDYQEIAQILQTQLGTVKSRIARAREKLRHCLQQHHTELLG